MAFIPKSGITTGGTIQASHITSIIESLDGTGSYEITATGSFSGSFVGNGSGITGVTATWNGQLNGDAGITGSLHVTQAVTASIVSASSFSGSFSGSGASVFGVVSSSFATSASYAVTASYATNAVVDVTNAGGLGTESDTLTIWYGDSSTLNVIVNNVDSASFATTASYVSPTFISASAAASGFGAGGGAAFPYSGSAQITGSLGVTGSIQVLDGAYINYTTQSVPLTIQTGYNALLVGPLFNSSSITIQAGARLVIL